MRVEQEGIVYWLWDPIDESLPEDYCSRNIDKRMSNLSKQMGGVHGHKGTGIYSLKEHF